MLVEIAGVNINTLFYVVDSCDPFAAILGQTWLGEFGAVSSPLHMYQAFYTSRWKYVQVNVDVATTIECNMIVLQLK